jgi:hypothetical protein
MKIAVGVVVALVGSAAAFVPAAHRRSTSSRTTTALSGYLDDLSSDLYSPDANPDVDRESREATKAKEEQIDRFGVGDWSGFVDFDEFDGGDGRK